MYEQTLEIEHRLSDLLRLVKQGRYSTPKLAELLDVSVPTISRGIKALRSRGHSIRSIRLDDGSWCYKLARIKRELPFGIDPQSSGMKGHASTRIAI